VASNQGSTRGPSPLTRDKAFPGAPPGGDLGDTVYRDVMELGKQRRSPVPAGTRRAR
jgi:hypothetical protein